MLLLWISQFDPNRKFEESDSRLTPATGTRRPDKPPAPPGCSARRPIRPALGARSTVRITGASDQGLSCRGAISSFNSHIIAVKGPEPYQFGLMLAENHSTCYCRGRPGGAIWGVSGINRKLSDHGMVDTDLDPKFGANHAIVLFDGVCNLCDASVRFIIARDRHDRFRFAALQSATGRSIAAEFGISGDLSTFFLIEGGRAYERSDAWLRILRNLGGPWSALNVFIIVPRPIRDWFYDFVGRNRYRWFGKTDYCPTPDPGLQHKFLA